MEKSSKSLEALRLQNDAAGKIHKPEFFRLKDAAQREAFYKLLEIPGIQVIDQIRDQVKEMIKTRNPSRRFSTNELSERINAEFRGDEELLYGVWVFYPWSRRLVHLLEKDDFIQVRTSRNQYKITPRERDELSTKKIGVIGLSVGQSVSVTLIMERICGEIRLADFDLLELTNLNRIRTGVHNLGVAKVYSVAREISEIDPYITVRCFPEGLTESNMNDFFLRDGKLDLVVEESDGFDIKILARYKARELGVPVLMEASDRCMVDVERFDLEPDRPILHGIVKNLDIRTLKSLQTNEEKIPYMLDVLGFEKTSTRLRASMLEMQQTISTWPQLASAVTMGGGITADVARRLLLGQFRSSGRYYVDVEQLIADKQDRTPPADPVPSFIPQDVSKFAGRPMTAVPGADHLSREVVQRLVEAGCKAPSAGNVQPWRWIYSNRTLHLFNAFEGDTTLLGFDNLASHMGLGAAALNVLIEAAELGLDTNMQINPDAPKGTATITFAFTAKSGGKESNHALAQAIGRRCTNRMLSPRKAIESHILQALQKSVTDFDPSFGLKFYTDSEKLDEIGNLLGELEKLRVLDEEGHREFMAEIRWTPEQCEATGDGIDVRTFDLSASEQAAFDVARDPRVIDYLRQWNGGEAFSQLAKKAISCAGAVGMLYSAENSKDRFIRGGMAMQRLWLEITVQGLGLHPMGAPVFMLAPPVHDLRQSLTAETAARLDKLRPDFHRIFDVQKNFREIFIFKLALAPEPAFRSQRKPLEAVFLYKD